MRISLIINLIITNHIVLYLVRVRSLGRNLSFRILFYNILIYNYMSIINHHTFRFIIKVSTNFIHKRL